MRWTFNERFDRQKLADYLYNRLRWEFYSPGVTASEQDLPESLCKALVLLESNYDTCDINTIAHFSGVSRPHLFTLFRKHLNTTPHKYLLQVRLRRARVFLAGSNEPIKEIAERCGFSSVTVFYRVFSEKCGITPAQYRMKNFALGHPDLLRAGIHMEP